MAFHKKTLRTMSPTARKVARLAAELDSISRRLKNLVPQLQSLDLDSLALQNTRHISLIPAILRGEFEGLGNKSNRMKGEQEQ